jgi:hypothetical protein
MQLLSCPRRAFRDRSGWARSGSLSPMLAACSATTGGATARALVLGLGQQPRGGRPGRWRRSCCAPGCGACPAPIGHRLLVRDPGRSDPMLVSPLTALMRLRGSWHDFQLHTCPLAGGETIRLDCSAAPEQYNDLGEGIRQTLLGTCRVDGASAVSGSAGQKSEATDFPATPPQALWRLTHPYQRWRAERRAIPASSRSRPSVMPQGWGEPAVLSTCA